MLFNSKRKPSTEPEDTAVFTTRFVMIDKRPITYVTHEEEDGAWQFFSNDQFEDFESVAMVVGFGEIIMLDPSVKELAQMPVGHFASRESPLHRWSIFVQKRE